MALVGDPLFLVMDEPTTGLDPETREALWRTLLKSASSVHSSHMLSSDVSMCLMQDP